MTKQLFHDILQQVFERRGLENDIASKNKNFI